MMKKVEESKNSEPKTETAEELEEDWTHTVRRI